MVFNFKQESFYCVKEIFVSSRYQSDADLSRWAQESPWGHHACCTAKIGGRKDSKAGLDSKFRVRSAKSLKVADANVFPEITGYYI